ncbi:BtrH N-terminal domain-containing protein [Candidatus Leptofilum sp.]|uniref:BtrH N-terminal domain-containing protein n=1 Tax=Candidatus Leptofilum sp. TaxID=3241576 RepID=UPI003B5CF3D6
MNIQPLAGFNHFYTHHCVTGSMAEVYHFNHHPLTEEMLLGLGEGVGYIYWQQKGAPPFMGGRSQPKPSMEALAAQRTGVKLGSHSTSSSRKAKKTLLEMLNSGQPVMLQVDMGFLPYFDFGGTEYHFGGHTVVACGYDETTDTVLISERDGLYPVPMADLAKARNSKFKPFPPKNRWLTFDFSEKRQPLPEELHTAVHNMATLMLEPPISNFGVKGIRKTAVMLPKWPEQLTADELKWALFNAYIFVSAVGGSGGGMFRYMLSRFLCETAVILQDTRFEDTARAFKTIGDAWEAFANWSKQTSEAENPAAHLTECVAPLQRLADMEAQAWTELKKLLEKV